MNLATDLLKANHIGIRDFKEQLSKKFLRHLLVITERGVPVSINLPYSDALELVDIIDELQDYETMAIVQEGRGAIKKGTRGVPVLNLFDRIRKTRK